MTWQDVHLEHSHASRNTRKYHKLKGKNWVFSPVLLSALIMKSKIYLWGSYLHNCAGDDRIWDGSAKVSIMLTEWCSLAVTGVIETSSKSVKCRSLFPTCLLFSFSSLLSASPTIIFVYYLHVHSQGLTNNQLRNSIAFFIISNKHLEITPTT